jgi:prevent-host-death family protein
MLQIINITDARNNLAKIIQRIKATNEPVVIVQDSIPSAVIYPYDEIVKKEEEKEQLFELRFKKLLTEGKEIGKKYLKENNISQPLSEEDAYRIIKDA